MKLLLPHKTLRTFMSQTLHSILAQVLLCIGSSTTLVVGCQPEDTCCQCCFVSTGRMCFVEVVAANATAVEAPTLRVHFHANEGVLFLTATPPELLFLVRSIAA
jgi:hypothetical protein